MSMTTHERPGVYSSYEASTLVTGNEGAKVVGLAVLSEEGTPGTAVLVTSYSQAAEEFGSEDKAAVLARTILENGAAGVAVVPVANETKTDYQAAFTALQGVEAVKIVVCDSTETEIQQALRDHVQQASQLRLERIAVVEGAKGETVTNLVQRAAGLNSERVVLAAPGQDTEGLLAAAVAGAIAGETDPAVPLGGTRLAGTEVTGRYGDNDLDLLIRGGVTAVEESGGAVTVTRGVTTRTKTGDAADSTWRELTTILIVDEVIPGIRDALRSRFQRSKNTEQTRGAIRSQVVLELEDRVSREIITGYDQVSAQPLESDPTVCLVEFSFTVAHGLNQIWLTAHITV